MSEQPTDRAIHCLKYALSLTEIDLQNCRISLTSAVSQNNIIDYMRSLPRDQYYLS